MLNIVTALGIEAKEIIRHFKLKGNGFVYKNEKINLIITGQGKIKSALNTALLLNRFKYPTVNFGICGSNRHNINEGFFIHKITDTDSKLDYYPDFFKEKSEEIFTVSRIGEYYTLVDMESSGFFEACYKFLNVNEIVLYKIVSDTPWQKPDIKAIPELIKSHIHILENLIAQFDSQNDFFEEINNALYEAQNKIRLTDSQKQQLKQILTLYKIKNRHFPEFHKIEKKEEVKKFITSLFFSLET
jgi:hypothetical protein